MTKTEISRIPGVAELAEWAKTLPSRDSITREAVAEQVRERFTPSDLWDVVPGNVRHTAIVAYAKVRLAGTYDEFRAEDAR